MAMATPTQTWTLSSLIGAFIDLSLAYLLLCGAALTYAASTFLSLFGLSLPLPIDGLFGRPTATIASVHSSLRSRSPLASVLCPDSPEFTELRHRKGSSPAHGKPLPPAELSGSVSGAEDAGLRGSGRTQSLGNEGMLIRDLEQALEEEQAARAALYLDLEKERSAAATAADEAMAMILRLQEEKAAVKMEARQYRRMVEEKSLYDAEEMEILKEIVLRREMDKHFLEKELEGYRFHGGKEGQHVEEKLLEDDPQLRGADAESEDPVLVLHQILGKMKSKGVKKQDDTWSPTSGAQVHAAVGVGEEGIAEDTISSNRGDIKQAYRFENHPLDKSDSGCESPLEFQEKGVVKVNVSPSSEQRQGPSYGESSHKAASVLLKEQDGAKDVGQKVSDSSQFEAELRVLDVYAIDDRLNLADGGNDNDADLSQMRCGNGIYGKVGPVVESAGIDMIGLTYINLVSASDSGSVEQNISRSSSDMTSAPRLMGTLSHKPSPFNLRRSSMSAINNERSRLEIEVELLRKRLESVQQGRERLSLTRENKEDESFQLHLLEEMACQLQEMRKSTEPERNVHQALLPPLSSKVVSKKRSCHSVSWGLQDST